MTMNKRVCYCLIFINYSISCFYFFFSVLTQESSETQTSSELAESLTHDNDEQVVPNSTAQTPSEPVPYEEQATGLTPNVLAIKRRGPPYICDCGYDGKRKIARIVNHQREGACPKNKRTAQLIRCPVCPKSFTFSGLKSHLQPFTKTSSRSTYSHEHSHVSVEKHKQILDEIKLKYAPKKLRLCAE